MPTMESSNPLLRPQEQQLVHGHRIRLVVPHGRQAEPWTRSQQLQRQSFLPHAYPGAIVDRQTTSTISRHVVPETTGIDKCQLPSTLGCKSSFEDFYLLGDLIGEGSYGKVYVATCKTSLEQWAVKILPKHRSNKSTEQNLALITAEISAWASVQGSRHVAHLEGVYEDEQSVYIVQELCLGTDLKVVLKDHGPLCEREAAQVVSGVMEVMAECHRHGICYGDIKPANFLLKWPYPAAEHLQDTSATAGRLDVRVVDFGCSQPLGAIRRKSGTPLYMAPEMFQSAHGRPADVWAVGVVMYQLLTGRLPFWDKELEDLQCLPPHVVVSGIQYNQIRLGSGFGVKLSPQAEDLLKLLLNRSPQMRITAEAALQHPWLQTNLTDTSQPSASTHSQENICRKTSASSAERSSASASASASDVAAKSLRNSSLDSSASSQGEFFDVVDGLDGSQLLAAGSLLENDPELLLLSQKLAISGQGKFLKMEQSRFSVSIKRNVPSGKPGLAEQRANNVVRLHPPIAAEKCTPEGSSHSDPVTATPQ